MAKEFSFPNEKDIERLLSLQGSDRGFFVLALYSMIEKFLRHRHPKQPKSAGFHEVLLPLLAQVPPPQKNILHQILKGRKITNLVRHEFGQITREETIAAISRFKQFATMNGFYTTGKLHQLDETLKAWDERQMDEVNSELAWKSKRVWELTCQNRDLASKIEEYEALSAQVKTVNAQDSLLEAELEELKEKVRKKDEKCDQLRKEKYLRQQELEKTKKDLQKRLEEFSYVQEYIEQLTRLSAYTRTRLDYEKSLVRLTAEQQNIVRQMKLDKDFLVKGSAGTGKSMVLLKALEKVVVENKNQLALTEPVKAVLLTFTKSLVKYNSYIASLMDLNSGTDCQISTVDQFLSSRFRKLFPGKNITYERFSKEEITAYFEPGNTGMTAEELYREADVFLWANNITEEEYCQKEIRRTGMKNAIRKEQRQNIWNSILCAEKRLREDRVWPRSFAMQEMQKVDIPEELQVDYLFIDEVQDLPTTVIAALKRFTRSSMILAGDADQSIFCPGFSWKRAGIKLSGYSRILHTNFRNTDQIHDLAEKYRKKIPGMDPDSSPQTFRVGPPPELSTGKTTAELYELIFKRVDFCLKHLSYEPENICIIAPKKGHLEALQLELRARLELNSEIVSGDNFDFLTPGIIRLSTMQSCKGLDFPVVLFFLDHRPHTTGSFDPVSADRMDRNMIYVSLTRAMEYLHVFTLEEPKAEAIRDLVQSFPS